MTPSAHADRQIEIELKLALPTADPAGLAQRLATLPLLARRPATRQTLHNLYHDTPDQRLRRQGMALRLRRIDGGAAPQWRQTLKLGGKADSALSERGEWESTVPAGALVWTALADTPWARIDPDASLFHALQPCFSTDFERLSWQLRQRDGSVVELALDIGQIRAGEASAPICELELELLAGAPDALFALAARLARVLPTLPLHASKAERGYALAEGRLDEPRHAQPPVLEAELPLTEAAARVLREMFGQFVANLEALRHSDEPELVHQARVGWRRFRSARRMFRSVLADEAPSSQPLQALLQGLGQLRDLDVARNDTLPPLAQAYVAGDARRQARWQAMQQALDHAAGRERQTVRQSLEAPAVGLALLAATRWLQSPATAQETETETLTLRRWARRRILRLHSRLQQALDRADSPAGQHRARILAKRLRYGIEALQPLLPRRAQGWRQQAVALQTELGATRDLQQAGELLAALAVDRELTAFVRGVAAGREGLQRR